MSKCPACGYHDFDGSRCWACGYRPGGRSEPWRAPRLLLCALLLLPIASGCAAPAAAQEAGAELAAALGLEAAPPVAASAARLEAEPPGAEEAGDIAAAYQRLVQIFGPPPDPPAAALMVPESLRPPPLVTLARGQRVYYRPVSFGGMLSGTSSGPPSPWTLPGAEWQGALLISAPGVLPALCAWAGAPCPGTTRELAMQHAPTSWLWDCMRREWVLGGAGCGDASIRAAWDRAFGASSWRSWWHEDGWAAAATCGEIIPGCSGGPGCPGPRPTLPPVPDPCAPPPPPPPLPPPDPEPEPEPCPACPAQPPCPACPSCPPPAPCPTPAPCPSPPPCPACPDPAPEEPGLPPAPEPGWELMGSWDPPAYTRQRGTWSERVQVPASRQVRLSYWVDVPSDPCQTDRCFSVWLVWGAGGWRHNLSALSGGAGDLFLRAGWNEKPPDQSRDPVPIRLLPGRSYRVTHLVAGGLSEVTVEDGTRTVAARSRWLKGAQPVTPVPAVIPAGTLRVETGYRAGENPAEAPWPGMRLRDVRLEVHR